MKRTAEHATFTIERFYRAPVERVFGAFQDPGAKAQWFIGGDDWQELQRGNDFTVGGEEVLVGRSSDCGHAEYRSRYEEIVPNARIIFCYRMFRDKTPISVSLATVQFHESEDGTKLAYTEQLVCLDGFDDPEGRGREHGTREHFDRLERFLERIAVTK